MIKNRVCNAAMVCLFLGMLNCYAFSENVEFCEQNLGWGPSSSDKSGVLIEGFDDDAGWSIVRPESGKEKMTLSVRSGRSGNVLRAEYEVPEDGHFVGFTKPVDFDFNEHRKVSFWLRAKGLPNQVELKIVDSDGGTFIRRMFSGAKTSDWHKAEFDISEITYGWGGSNKVPDPPYKLELIISRELGVKGAFKGWVEFDELRIIGADPHIELSMNQVGFEPAGIKRAVVKLVNSEKKVNPKVKFKIVTEEEGERVFGGRARKLGEHEWGGYYWLIKFDEFDEPGDYKLIVETTVDNKKVSLPSYTFSIRNNILIDELSEPQFYYIKSTRYPERTNHYDPVPGGYIDTELDIEKWMSTTPTWVWAMARWARILLASSPPRRSGPEQLRNEEFDPIIDEIEYAARFCLAMQDAKTGGVYIGVNKKFDGCWPAYMTAELDDNDLFLNKGHAIDINTAYTVAMSEVSMALKGINSRLSRESLKAAVLSWEFVSEKQLDQAADIGMFVWATMRLYEATNDEKYLNVAKNYAEELLNLQYLDYSRSDERIFGRFFRNMEKRDFNHQHKFVHAMGIQMGLLELAEVLEPDDPFREKLLFRLDCFAYGYLKRTTELNPYGLVAQALEPEEDSKKIKRYFFASPNSNVGDHGLNCDIMAMGIIALRYARLTNDRLFAEIAENQINWVLGKNPLGFCMISGVGTTNPWVVVSHCNKGPVRGGLPNGYVSPGDEDIPKWVIDWNSGEYWKPHNAMLLVLMAELESDNFAPVGDDVESKRKEKEVYRKVGKLIKVK
ncbi:MAG: glycoside hydrolase family 9 protein [Elusimicrobia bacterium]|nr:glycoside hydrolase family 9 protein [Elusimicrobiota bacterium]